MSKIVANGKTFDSEDVTVVINGVPLEVSEIKYNAKKQRQNNYSLGSDRPTSWSSGKREYEGSMSILSSNATIIESSAGGDLLSIKPFVITVGYLNEYNKIVVDKITAMFNNQGREVNGDMGLQYTYELHIIEIVFDSE